MLKEKESAKAKYTAGGKRKFTAKVINVQNTSQSIFSRSAPIPEASPIDPNRIESKLRFAATKSDFRKKGKEETLPFKIPSPEEPTEKPEERQRNLPKPDEEFNPTQEDFREKKD